MVCNSGVSLVPNVDGKSLNFDNVGLYDALFIMQDRETETLWNHISGEALYGELAGQQLELSNLLQVTVKQALAKDPAMQVAISDRPYGGKAQMGQNTGDAKLMDMFEATLAEEDGRRPRMEMGLGIWTEKTRRYYPIKTLREKGKVIIDQLDGKNLLVYLDPVTSTPGAMYVDADSASLDGKDIVLDSSGIIRSGVLMDNDNQPVKVDRPRQIYTRWYGYALTFPDPEIYE